MQPAKRIRSRDNPAFKEWGKLAGSARQRRKAGQTLLDGAHLLRAYLTAGNHPLQLLISDAALLNKEIVELIEQLPEVPLTCLDDSLFAELSELKTPGGLLALIAIPSLKPAPAQSHFAVLLEDIQDPGNVGSILRTAAAAGCDAVFLSEACADVWSPRVLRAAMGGHFALEIYPQSELAEVIAAFPGKVFATALQASSSLYDTELTGDVAFIFGNEGAGLSAELAALCLHQIVIPMHGKIESLNVAAAAAVCLFEAAQQRSQGA